MKHAWEREVAELLGGGLVIYPTETFYALGCMATRHSAVERVVAAKGRPGDKALPLIIADWDMVERFVRLTGPERELARRFWPGPLSLVVDVVPGISPLACDSSGRSAVRMSPHPIATELCRAAGAPLVSSSANLSGRSAVSRPQDLDPELLRTSGALVLGAEPWPAGGLPSTLVAVEGERTVRLLRAGAVPVTDIVACGFDVAG